MAMSEAAGAGLGGFMGLRRGLDIQDAKQREGALNAVLMAYSPWLAPELVKQVNLGGITGGVDIFEKTKQGAEKGANAAEAFQNKKRYLGEL